MMNDKRKDEIKTVSKMLMEHSAEHAESIKVNKDGLRKINKVRKHNREMLPHELVRSSKVALTSCRREKNEVSSAS